MADIIQMEPSQYNINHRGNETEPQYRDLHFILMVLLAVLALLTAIGIGIYLLFFYDETTSPLEVQTFVILQVVFGLLSIGLYIAAVWKALNNGSLQAGAGCPSCHNHELMRISRHRTDRLITLSGIRVARYQCRQCHWNGRRVFRGNYHPLSRVDLKELDNAYVKPSIVPVSKPVISPKHPESLLVEFEQEVEITEAEVELVNLGLEIPASEMAVVETEALVTSEALDHSTIDVSTIDKSMVDTPAPDLLQENEEIAKPVEVNTQAEAGNLGQASTPINSEKAKINTTFGINLKKEPRSDSQWVGMLGPDTIVSLQKSEKMDDGTVWYFVDFQDQSGWVESSCLVPAK